MAKRAILAKRNTAKRNTPATDAAVIVATSVTDAAEIMAARPSDDTGHAAAVVAAAASLATTAVASAAATATTTLTEAATLAAKVVAEAANKAINEFPRLQDDIREIRAAQSGEAASLTKAVTILLEAHTVAEDIRLKSIEATCTRIDTHLTGLNDRVTVTEKHITQHQLILFGIAGPVCLLIIGAVLTIFMNSIIPTIAAWFQ